MKKIIVLIGMMFFLMNNTFAQKGIKGIGAHLSYGTEIEMVGLGLKFQYNITDNIRLEPSMNYFFKNEGINQFDVNANAHYLFPMSSNIRIYPLAGLTFARWNFDSEFEMFSNDVTRLGVNLGGGAEMDITSNLLINCELKYQFVSDLDQAIFNIGIAYIF
jgi:outer membrane protein X